MLAITKHGVCVCVNRTMFGHFHTGRHGGGTHQSYRLRIFFGGGTMQYFSFVYVPDIDAWELGIIELMNNIFMLSHP